MTRFPELEGYRGMAALLVITFHAYQTSRVTDSYIYAGMPVVDPFLRNIDTWIALFFGLSGFLIWLPFARSIVEGEEGMSARGFLIRRAIRILPLYYVAISIVWATRYNGTADTWLDLLQHLTFVQVFSTHHIFFTIGPAWSLADEVWFYAFVTVFAYAWIRIGRRIEHRTVRCLALSASILLLTLLSTGGKAYIHFVADVPFSRYAFYFNPLVKFDEFGMGMLLAMVSVLPRTPRRMLGRRGALISGLFGVACVLAVITFRGPHHIWMDVYGSTLTGVGWIFIYAATILGPRGSRLERTMTARWLMYVGVISYSTYLWHEPILFEATTRHWLSFFDPVTWPLNTLALLTLAVMAGVVSYWLIESPVTEMRHLFTGNGSLKDRYTPRSGSPVRTAPAPAPPPPAKVGPPVGRTIVPAQRNRRGSKDADPPAVDVPPEAPRTRRQARQRSH